MTGTHIACHMECQIPRSFIIEIIIVVSTILVLIFVNQHEIINARNSHYTTDTITVWFNSKTGDDNRIKKVEVLQCLLDSSSRLV